MSNTPSEPQDPKHQESSSEHSSLIVDAGARALQGAELVGSYARPLIWAGAILFILLLLGMIPRWMGGHKLTQETQAEAKSLPTVTVAKAERSPAVLTLTLPGNIEAQQVTQLNARTSGFVERYYVDIGDRVTAGQLLATIQTPEVDQEARQADADLARAQATVSQSYAQLAQQEAAQQRAKASAAQARANLARADQTAAQQVAQVREARANADLAKVTWERWQNLVDGGAISKQEADEKHAAYQTAQANLSALIASMNASKADREAFRQALEASLSDITAAAENVKSYQSAVKAAQAGVAAAQSNVQRYRVLTGFRDIRAPYAGIITSRGVEAGALVNAGSGGSVGGGNNGGTSQVTDGTGLFTLARLDSLRIYVDVPQTSASDVRPGQLAQVIVRELPNRKFTGTVNRTTSSLSDTTRTLRTEVALMNQGGVLLPGMYAQVQFHVTKQDRPLLIPAAAIITDAKGTHVATVENGAVAFHDVNLGRDYGESVEITDGLQDDSRVITNLNDDIKPGVQVNAVAAKPADAAGGAPAGGKGKKPAGPPPSLYQQAEKDSSREGGEAEAPESQPGGVARAAARKS